MTWLPDGPAGWGLLAVIVAVIVWWGVRWLPRRFARTTLESAARQHGWLIKTGADGHADLDGGGAPSQVSWQHHLPRTDLELLGEHRGYLFHVFQQRTRVTTSAGHPGEPSYRWRYDYVVSLAASATPYDGFFTRGLRKPVADRRMAVYPAFLEWERPIVSMFDSASYVPPEGVRNGQGIVSTDRKDQRLSRRELFDHLDHLVTTAQR